MARAALDFIFMFTHADETVGDCLEVFETAARAGVKHMGFKDLGVPYEILVELNRRIKAAGAVSYFEVVSSTTEACLESARVARRIGVDCVMGGTEAGEILAILEGSGIEYHFAAVAGSRDAPERSRRGAALLSGIGADVLHVHGLAFAGDAFAVSRRLPRMPILCQDHADRPPRWWRRRPWKRWYAAVSGVSFTAAEQAQRFIDAGDRKSTRLNSRH